MRFKVGDRVTTGSKRALNKVYQSNSVNKLANMNMTVSRVNEVFGFYLLGEDKENYRWTEGMIAGETEIDDSNHWHAGARYEG